MKIQESVFKTCDVVLPRRVDPVFPHICIMDGASEPDATITIRDFSISWIFFLIFLTGPVHTVSVPIASQNIKPFKKKRRRARTIVYLSFLIGVLFVIYFLPVFHSSIDWWIAPMTAFLFVLPATLYNFLNPPPFDFTAYPKKVGYEFSNDNYATEFYLLNSQNVLSLELTIAALDRLSLNKK